MKTWLVDTDVLLDVLGADATFGGRSARTLSACAQTSVLVVNAVILAEVSALPGSEELADLVPPSLFRRDDIPLAASFLAGQAYAGYKRRGGQKPRMLADFLIGAHAAVTGFGFISRDLGYGKVFDLELLDPAQP